MAKFTPIFTYLVCLQESPQRLRIAGKAQHATPGKWVVGMCLLLLLILRVCVCVCCSPPSH